MDIVVCETTSVVVGACLVGVSKVTVLLALPCDVLSHVAGYQCDSELPQCQPPSQWDVLLADTPCLNE